MTIWSGGWPSRLLRLLICCGGDHVTVRLFSNWSQMSWKAIMIVILLSLPKNTKLPLSPTPPPPKKRRKCHSQLLVDVLWFWFWTGFTSASIDPFVHNMPKRRLYGRKPFLRKLKQDGLKLMCYRDATSRPRSEWMSSFLEISLSFFLIRESRNVEAFTSQCFA